MGEPPLCRECFSLSGSHRRSNYRHWTSEVFVTPLYSHSESKRKENSSTGKPAVLGWDNLSERLSQIKHEISMVDGKHDYRPKAPDYIRVIDGSSFGASLQPRKRKSSSNWLALGVLDTSAMMNAARRRNPCFPTRDKMTERSTSDMIGHYTPRKMIAGGSNFTPVS